LVRLVYICGFDIERRVFMQIIGNSIAGKIRVDLFANRLPFIPNENLYFTSGFCARIQGKEDNQQGNDEQVAGGRVKESSWADCG
jgi:hypothetical protein